jgi:hypothetical protein
MKSPLLLAAIALLFGMSVSVWAKGRELVTALSRDVVAVGESVPLVYRFVNTPDPADMPQSIPVEGGGLEIALAGTRRQSSANFSIGPGGLQDLSQSAIEYTYIVRALSPGPFTIRSFWVNVGGRQMKTEPVKLRVVDTGASLPRVAPAQPAVPQSPGNVMQQLMDQFIGGMLPQMQTPQLPVPMPQPGMAPPIAAQEGEEFFAEMTLGAKTAYVGEVVPLDLRFYFRADMVPDGFELDPARIRLSGEGFSVARPSQPTEATSDRDGVSYRVFTAHTAITPNKTGDLDIPPAELGIKVISRQMFGQVAQDRKILTNKAKLRVEPLPKEGKPLSFSGAIGQDLDFSGVVDPKSAEPGEPLNYTLSLKGRGNFDAIVAPELNSTTGWKTYQPKENFEPHDAAGFGGTKTFEYTIVAKHDQTATPGAEFSYFDPAKKEYVTLTADPLPVDAKGHASAATEPLPQVTQETPKSERGSSKPREGIAEPAKELLRGGVASLAPLARNPWFWWINFSLASAFLIALPLVFWLRRRAAKNAVLKELRWAIKQARSALTKASDREEFYNAAAHFVQARLAFGEGRSTRFIETANTLKRQIKDPVFHRELEAVLGRRDEIKYGGRSAGSLDIAEKNRVIALLDKLDSIHD